MLDPNDIPKAIEVLKDRVEKKQNLIKFTEIEIGELKRTIEKMSK